MFIFAVAERSTPFAADFRPSIPIMNPNLKWKALFILAVILFCIYGLLGLDLQGGTHLVLQVQVQEAIAQETDQMVDRLTKQLRDKNIHYDEIRRVDDTHVLVRNVDSNQAAAFRDFVQQQYGAQWEVAPAAGETSGYALTLRPTALANIQTSTMSQSVETISRRV